jgi:hypothetical protein
MLHYHFIIQAYLGAKLNKKLLLSKNILIKKDNYLKNNIFLTPIHYLFPMAGTTQSSP